MYNCTYEWQDNRNRTRGKIISAASIEAAEVEASKLPSDAELIRITNGTKILFDVFVGPWSLDTESD